MAPGKELEFFHSEFFKKRTVAVPDLAPKIVSHLQSWPTQGIEIAGGVKELKMEFGEKSYIVVFRRNVQRVGLMYVYEIPEELGALEAQRVDILERYSKK